MSRIVLFHRIECSGVESSRYHCHIIFPLPKIAAKFSIAGICDKHHRVGIVVVNRFTNGVVLRQALDVAEGLVVLREPFKFGAFAGEIREYSRPF